MTDKETKIMVRAQREIVTEAREAAAIKDADWMDSAATAGVGTRAIEATRNSFTRIVELDNVRLFLLILTIGVFIRMLLSLIKGTYTDLGRDEMERVALSLASSGRLADPYIIPTGYSAHVAPGYALVLAATFRIFGTGYLAEIIKELISSGAAAAQYALLPLAAPMLDISRKAGLAAALFGALVPMKYLTEVQGDWEATFAGLALVLLVWATATSWRDHRFPLWGGICQGLGWGVALLISPSLLPVLLALIVVGFVLHGQNRPRFGFGYMTCVLLVAIACLIPWVWRNQLVLGAPILTRSNFGMEIHLSNNDFAGPLDRVNYKNGLYRRFHPLSNLREAQAVRDMGEVSYNRDRLYRAISWMRTHPSRVLTLTFQRFFYTWFPVTTERGRDAVLWCITVTSAFGLLTIWRSHRSSAWLFGACLFSFTPVYYLIHVSVRYRYPVDWILLLLSAHFIIVTTERLIRQRCVQIS